MTKPNTSQLQRDGHGFVDPLNIDDDNVAAQERLLNQEATPPGAPAAAAPSDELPSLPPCEWPAIYDKGYSSPDLYTADQMLAYGKACRAHTLTDEVRAALRPFADAAFRYDDVPGVATHDNVQLWQDGRRIDFITIGDLRRARAILAAGVYK